ncbi:MAG: type I-B CRISPR-associated protein Cas7/Cst2/DevR [Lachnospiraceae bacterium]|nr:type I-B CRISPR-associated protein Cas7/Cst2/DevR [Lachnospiraceae bacterium]
MRKKALTLTVVANMTSNYSEGLGNIASVQKVFKNRKVYTIRSRESLKNSLMVQAGMYDDLQTEVDGATQKLVTEDLNAATCRALEGGYMSTKGTTYVRKSSLYLTDAISCESFVNETRFHNNLYLAGNFAEANGMNIQNDANKVGLMPYQYEYDKSLKIYSLTIDLEMVGKDENFKAEADKEEKAARVKAILDAVETLSLVVKGNLDNAEPIFVVGGVSDRKTHYFENVVHVEEDKLEISQDLIDKVDIGYDCGLLRGKMLANEQEIEQKLKPMTIPAFFKKMKDEVDIYYEV